MSFKVADATPNGGQRVEILRRDGHSVFFTPRSKREQDLLLAGLATYVAPVGPPRAVTAWVNEPIDPGYGAVLDALQRRGRSIEDWLRALRAAGTGAATDMRTPPTDPEVLARLASDETAGKTDRVAAAIALRAAGRSDAVSRIRVLSASSDARRVRVALARVTEEATEQDLVEASSLVSDEQEAHAER